MLSRLVEEALTGQQKKPSKGGLDSYLSRSVSNDSFTSVFKEIAKDKLPVIRNNNDIHAFILKPELFPFSYSRLENLILDNITNYAISRGVNKSDVTGIKATKILRNYAHSGVPENIMGEMLTYIFLEHIDNAKKIYTRAEISAHSRTIDSEGIYLKNNQGIFQLILGASQLHDNLQSAIQNVISELRSFKNNQSESLIESTELVDSSILNEQYSKEINQLIEEVHPHYMSVPGIGPLSAAVIYSEYCDISNFTNPGQMLAFAGIEPGINESGTEAHGGKMVKRGSSQLRYTLINCCLPLIRFDMTFATYYAKKRGEGKPHREAITHVAKKLIRVNYAI